VGSNAETYNWVRAAARTALAVDDADRSLCAENPSGAGCPHAADDRKL